MSGLNHPLYFKKSFTVFHSVGILTFISLVLFDDHLNKPLWTLVKILLKSTFTEAEFLS